MRGGLDDALDRLARMDQLRRRAESASSGRPTAHGLAEAIEAVRQVVERHHDLNITLYGEQGEGSAEVRIGWEDGAVRAKIVSVEGPDGTSFGPSEGPLPVLPAEIPPMTDLPRPLPERPRAHVDAYPVGRHTPPPAVPETIRLVDPGRLGEPRRRHAAPEAGFLPDPGRLAPARPATPPPAAPSAWADPGQADVRAQPDGLPRRPRPRGWLEQDLGAERSVRLDPALEGQASGAGQPVEPRAWRAEHEDNPSAAARLAAMIREDPSLLTGPDER